MSTNNLAFFDKEGHYINFKYDDVSETYNGELIFDENGSDTFKTIGLYTFEKIPSFEFESNELALQKFQLFNEYGFNITGNIYASQSVTNIEPVNGDPNFFSKWIYGSNFESKYPIGSEIVFNSPIYEFTDPFQSYTVVSTKKGAIMIISLYDNQTFSGLTSSPYDYNGVTISGLNSIGVSEYLDEFPSENLSIWSEPSFYTMLYNGRKLNIINTQKNDGVITVKNKDIVDKTYFQYYLRNTDLLDGQDLIIETVLKTDLPLIYKGSINVLSDRIEFGSTASKLLKPGTQFVISGASLNTNFLTISNISTFLGNTQLTYYATASQVIWNNLIYESIQAYTQSATSSINPSSASYWTDNITYLPIDETLTPEFIPYAEIYLTTNRLYFSVTASSNSNLTLSFASEKYMSDFGLLNINLEYLNKTLNANLKYSSEYANVNFYHTKVGSTYSIGSVRNFYEKTVEIEETLKTEVNKDISERYSYNIVFTDIDEYGIIIEINGLQYQQEVQWVYSGINVDIGRTVDKTLRAWLSKHYLPLYRLGISCNLDYLINYPYVYFDSITLKTIYPNIPLAFNVFVGTTANYYIQHSNVIFYEIGNSLSIIINDNRYDVDFDTDVSTTLSNWGDLYSSILNDYKIFTSCINNTIYFNIKEYDKVLNYNISIGKSILPGHNSFKINSKIFGNLGALITSNSAILSTTQSSFLNIDNSNIENGFATGMITSINNTIYPFDNQEYNLLEVNTDKIVFSYQGPFWGGSSSIIFNGSTVSTIISTTGYGAYTNDEFDYSFDIIRGGVNQYSYSMTSSISNMVDIIYINTSEMIYVLGNNIKVYDGLSGDYSDTILLPGLSQSLKMVYNNVNESIYALSSTILYKIDPNTNFVAATYSLTYTPYDCIINDNNGDVYISYPYYNQIDIITLTGSIYGITSSYIGLTFGTYKMAYNQFEDDIYVTTNADNVLRINGSTRAEYTYYQIPGLHHALVYEPINSSIYVIGSTLSQINNGIVNLSSVPLSGTFSDIIYDNITQNIAASVGSSYYSLNLDNSLKYGLFSSNNGYLSINQYEEKIYLSSQNGSNIKIIDPSTGNVSYAIELSAPVIKLVYNPLRKSMWGILPSTNEIIEITVEIPTSIIIYQPSYNGVYDSQFGTLSKNYSPRPGIWLKSRDYIRKPRENFIGEQPVQYVWKWMTDEVPDIFMYDFSGSQLPTTGPYAYIGEKPLLNINLNKNQNKDIGKTSSSAYQQTIFKEIVYDIDYINDSNNLSYMPQPLELFIGFNSQDEGVISSTLLLLKREEVEFSIITNGSNINNILFETKMDTNGEVYGLITMDSNSSDNFIYDLTGSNRGLKVGQVVQIFIRDNTNTKNKFISFNNGIKFKIKELYIRSIKVKFLNGVFEEEETTIIDYPSSGKISYMTTTFKVVDSEVGRFIITGQTEIEDIRYKVELTNSGKNITADDVFIFKTYDINEQGVDWGFLNKKRKEMLLVKSDIYPYVGSYKAIINAINYFGYNDLELYEYYRNINIDSKDFDKLYKVEIPDIFDNTVAGWKPNDFIKHTMPNSNYEDTNLFNLTYRITDKDGNNVLLYSLPEVLIKLQGLKYWLQRNIIPLSHKILDITGRADFVAPTSIVHKNYDVKVINVKQSMSPFDFRLNEAYLMPINSGSTVYNAVIDFYNENKDTIPDYFDIKIKTYKTYPEWLPFKTYNNGDIISYYQQIYESTINDNRINNPRKFENVNSWNINFDYKQGQIVEYKRFFYEFIGTQSLVSSGTNSIVSPFTDVLNSLNNWVDVTEWRKIDYSPVQTINEFRTATHSFHFTVDTNIDPFITVEVTSDNGYGQNYSVKKNYELRGLLDITEEIRNLDEIGPIKIYNFLTTTTTAAPTTTSTTTTTTTLFVPTSTTTTTTTAKGPTFSIGLLCRITASNSTPALCATPAAVYYTVDNIFGTGRILYSDIFLTTPVIGYRLGICVTDNNEFEMEPGSGLINLPTGKHC